MDTYNLINSKAIREHCRKINHQFNTEELAVLVFRNKSMSIDEKISAYNELIENYDDMEVKKRINCEPYDSVKIMIKQEIARLTDLMKKLQQNEKDYIYVYTLYYKSTSRWGDYGLDNIYKTFDEVYNAVNKQVEEDEDILMYKIIKKELIQDKSEIKAEYIVDENNKSKMIDIFDSNNAYLDIDNICLNIPTPFKKGDILVASANTSYNAGTFLKDGKYVFVLNKLCNWDDKFRSKLEDGTLDSSDMVGTGYYISENNKLWLDYQFEYDKWDYFEGKLEGIGRLLKAVSSLLKDEISISLFLDAYDTIKLDNAKPFLDLYTEEGLKLVGLDDFKN
jgi:hypothetical protein